MFQIAGIIGIADMSGQDFAFPYWKNYDHLERFGSSEDIDIQKYFKNPLPILQQDVAQFQHRFVYWGYHPQRLTRGNWDIEGHLQCEQYFVNSKDKIKHYFELKDEQPQNEFVAVHIRLGDYDDLYHPRLKSDYYKQAMEQFPNERFVIFSDDPKLAYEIIAQTGCTNFSIHNNQHYMDDFGFMKSCKSFIIGNSTFSWWAAWLGNHPDKKVVAPKKWFGDFYLKSDDIYCKDWIVI